VLVDCDKCTHDYACCTVFPVQLTKEEAERFAHDVLPRSQTLVLKRRPSGGCIYFNPDSRKCAIWDTRPKTCREYDCHKDPRIIPLHRPQSESTEEPKAAEKIRLIVAVVAMDADETIIRTEPLSVTTNQGTVIPESLVMIAPVDQAVEMANYVIKPEIIKAIGNLTKG